MGIGRGLEADGILTGAGKKKWRAETLQKILKNEKYIGDALLQKTYTVDFLEKKRVPNAGTSTAGLYGITEERDLSCGAAAPGWNMVLEPAMPMLSMNQNYKTLWFEPLIWHLVKRILCRMSCREM